MSSELNEQQLELVRKIRTGNAINEFCGQEIAKFVFGRLEEMRRNELENLAAVDPHATTKIVAAQMRIKAIDMLPLILAEAVAEADAAKQEAAEQDGN